jgi:hypothetical protein
VEKKVHIYHMAHRDSSLTVEDDENEVNFVWDASDEVFDSLGLEKWAYADVADISAAVQVPRRMFYCYVEEGFDVSVLTKTRVAEAKLLTKHGGIRFYDADEGDDGSWFRIRRDQMSWKGKKFGGWAASCDLMPSGSPSEDPVGDIFINDNYEPEDYVINDQLYEMIDLAADTQAPGVLVIEADDDDDDDDDDDGEEAEGAGDEMNGDE